MRERGPAAIGRAIEQHSGATPMALGPHPGGTLMALRHASSDGFQTAIRRPSEGNGDHALAMRREGHGTLSTSALAPRLLGSGSAHDGGGAPHECPREEAESRAKPRVDALGSSRLATGRGGEGDTWKWARGRGADQGEVMRGGHESSRCGHAAVRLARADDQPMHSQTRRGDADLRR